MANIIQPITVYDAYIQYKANVLNVQSDVITECTAGWRHHDLPSGKGDHHTV